MRRSANKPTCDIWIMRHKLRLRSKLACFEFNQEGMFNACDLYTLFVKNTSAPLGPTTIYAIYRYPIKCEWRMSGRTKRKKKMLNANRKKKIVDH
ncbi:hypothetical protein X777_12067 [Ooceraea biroi]|uniref:Uncharacterized protein n=1 Tax=Ooceraea biroi TaxID=2015173 RepID=A0A026WZ67_OOCBI|nr:hypothetical protein X777_12067 [Ooceraea biroi]